MHACRSTLEDPTCLYLAWRADDGGAQRLRALARLEPPPAVSLVLRGEEPGSPLEEARARVAAGEFSAASERLSTLAAARPDDALVFFYLGVARLQLGPDEGALTALERAAELGEGLLAESALWYAANAHLARGEGQQARAALERLIGLDGDYEPNARELLRELEPLLD